MLRTLFTPSGELARGGKLTGGKLVHALELAVARARVNLVLLGVRDLVERIVEPAQTVLFFQHAHHGRIDARQVVHIVGSVFHLRRRKRAPAPIGERVLLRQGNVAKRLHQGSIGSLLALAQDGCGHLRVEHWFGHHARFVVQDLDILRRGMEYLHDALVGEHGRHHGKVTDAERIDNRHFPFYGHLHQAELCVIGFLTQELRVDCHIGAFRATRQEIPQLSVGFDEHVRSFMSIY